MQGFQLPPKENGGNTLEKNQSERPLVSICTVTYNRPHFLPLLEQRILEQTYSRERMEWVILDDSPANINDFAPTEGTGLKIIYKRLIEKIPLGKKRNTIHTLCSGDIFVYMDDDDYYPPTRIEHAVQKLSSSDALIAGSTVLPILFVPENELWIAGPYHQKHATAGTFAFKRELLEQTAFPDEANLAEEKIFLKDYSLDLIQLEPQHTIICIGHDRNTYEKRQLIRDGKNPRFKRLTELNPAQSDLIRQISACYTPLIKQGLQNPISPEVVPVNHSITNSSRDNLEGSQKKEPSLTPPISTMHNQDIHFKIVIPAFNAEAYIGSCIESIRNQNYRNYEAIIIDDGSTDGTAPLAAEAIKRDHRFKLYRNEYNIGSSLHNLLKGVQILQPSASDVIIFMDGDDRLLAMDALSIVAFTYQSKNCLVTYGSFIRASTNQYVGCPYDERTIMSHSFRKSRWCASHLKTFKAGLLKLIDIEDLKDESGNMIKRATDFALMHPLLELASGRSAFISAPIYWYNDLNPINIHSLDHEKQANSARRIRARLPYAPAPFLTLESPCLTDGISRENHRGLSALNFVSTENMPMVSVITPTKNREVHLLNIIKHFQSQTWPKKELLILDDSDHKCTEAERIAKQDSRIQYIYRRDLNRVGEKRQHLCELANGSIIAHFDDDDYYLPTYLEFMIESFKDTNADFVKLRSWWSIHEPSKVYGYCNTALMNVTRFYHVLSQEIRRFPRPFTEQETYRSLYGYGFSYLYKKSILEKVSHPKTEGRNLDLLFADSCIKEGIQIKLIDDILGQVFHIIHSNNTSSCFANHLIHESMIEKLTDTSPVPHIFLNSKKTVATNHVPAP